MGKSSKRTLDQATASDAAAPAAMEVDSAAPPAVASPTKKSKKDKKDKSGAATTADGDDKEVGLEQLAEIAKPLAVKKTGKHVLRLVKKGEFLASCHTPRRACCACLVHGYKVYACPDEATDSGEGVMFAPFSMSRLTFCTASFEPSLQVSTPETRRQGGRQVDSQRRKGVRGRYRENVPCRTRKLRPSCSAASWFWLPTSRLSTFSPTFLCSPKRQTALTSYVYSPSLLRRAIPDIDTDDFALSGSGSPRRSLSVSPLRPSDRHRASWLPRRA